MQHGLQMKMRNKIVFILLSLVNSAAVYAFKVDSLQYISFKGKILDSESKKPIKGIISFEKIPDRDNIGIIYSDSSTGNYLMKLIQNSSYKIIVQAPHYIKSQYTIKNTSKEKNKIFYLIPLKVGQVFKINTIAFEKGTAKILPESYDELDMIYQMLVENRNMEIQLEGHTDNIGPLKANLELSEDRAGAVKIYLVKKGIKKKRISVEAFGGTKPITNNSTEANRQKNRRVEVRITKE